MARDATDLSAQRIADTVAKREHALAVLRAARSRSLIYALAPVLVAAFVVGLGLSGMQMSFWPKLVVSVGCILAFETFVLLWRIQRQVRAAVDLLLLRDDAEC